METMLGSIMTFLIITILLAILSSLIFQIINLCWSLLMATYSLSLPAFLWGGGAFSFPKFITVDATSPMRFYYWFFIVAVLVMIVFFVFNAFRQLAIWGKFDESQAGYEQTNFWHKFKWVLFLGFMTFLTPIIIWAIYSVLMLGVYFFMNMIDKRVMFTYITKNEFNALKDQASSWLKQFTGEDFIQQGKDLATIFQKLSSDASWTKISEYLKATSSSTYTTQVLNQIKYDFQQMGGTVITNAFSSIQSEAKTLLDSISNATFETGIDSTVYGNFCDKINSLFTSTVTGTEINQDGTVNYSFGYLWARYFGSNSGALTFQKLCEIGYGTEYSGSIAEQYVTNWQNFTGVFNKLGYGNLTNLSYSHGQNTMAYLLGQYDYSISYYDPDTKKDVTASLNMSYLGFVNGEEIGLKTCPLVKYVTRVCTNKANYQQELWGFVAVISAQFVSGGAALVIYETEVWGTKIACGVGLAMMVVAFIAAAACFLTVAFTSIIYIMGIFTICKPLFGLTVFCWINFFESFWYFLLLLPAIGATVNDQDHSHGMFQRAFKKCIGHMSGTLLVWAGIIMMFAALFKLDGFYDLLLNGAKGFNQDWNSLYIGFDFNFDNITSTLAGVQGICAKLYISVPNLIKLIIVSVILTSAGNFIPKVGSGVFGEGVFEDSARAISEPLKAIAPSFAAAAGLAAGLGKSAISPVAAGAKGAASAAGGAGKKTADAKHRAEQAAADKQKGIAESDKSAEMFGTKDIKSAPANLSADMAKYGKSAKDGGFQTQAGRANVEQSLMSMSHADRAKAYNNMNDKDKAAFKKQFFKDNSKALGGDAAAQIRFDSLTGQD